MLAQQFAGNLLSRYGEMPRVTWTYRRLVDALQSKPLLASVVVLLLVCAGSVALGTILGLMDFRDVGYPDSAILLRVGELIHSGHIYPSIDRPPYLVTLYGPFTYALLELPYALAQAAGINPQVPVRLAIVGAFCICLLLIFLISRQLYNRPTQIAWLSVLFAMSAPSLAIWTTQIRPDFVAAAFSLTSVYLLLLSNRRLLTMGAAICAALAVLAKQTFLAVPVTIICWHVYNRRYRDVAFWAGCFVMTVVGGYGLLLWREPLMLEHIAAILSPVLEYRGALAILLDVLLQPVVPFAALGGIMVLRNRTPERLPILIYCLVVWLIAIITIPQAGGNINYFWEPLMASAVLAGPGLWKLRKVKHTPLLVTSIFLVLVLRSFLTTALNNSSFLMSAYQNVSNYQVRRAKWESFVATISERRLLSTLPDVTIHSKTPEIPDPFLNAVLEIRGRWDSGPVVAQIDSGVYDLVVIQEGEAEAEPRDSYRGIRKWSQRIWSAVKRRYSPVCTFEHMEIWLPVQGSDEILRNLLAIGCLPVANQTYDASAPVGP